MLPDEAGIIIEPRAAWCERHLEPFRKNWPVGYLPATLCLVHQALLRDDVAAAADYETAMLNRVLREFGPLCCLLGDETADAITKLALGDTKALRQLLKQYGPPPQN